MDIQTEYTDSRSLTSNVGVSEELEEFVVKRKRIFTLKNEKKTTAGTGLLFFNPFYG